MRSTSKLKMLNFLLSAGQFIPSVVFLSLARPGNDINPSPQSYEAQSYDAGSSLFCYKYPCILQTSARDMASNSKRQDIPKTIFWNLYLTWNLRKNIEVLTTKLCPSKIYTNRANQQTRKTVELKNTTYKEVAILATLL